MFCTGIENGPSDKAHQRCHTLERDGSLSGTSDLPRQYNVGVPKRQGFIVSLPHGSGLTLVYSNVPSKPSLVTATRQCDSDRVCQLLKSHLSPFFFSSSHINRNQRRPEIKISTQKLNQSLKLRFTMSSHEQNLPQEQNLSQNPSNHPEFVPFIHPPFVIDSYPTQAVPKACADLTLLDDNCSALGQEGPDDPKIHANEAQEFLDIWIKRHTDSDHDKICGYWVLQGWNSLGGNALVIARYKTLQICIRAGPRAEEIMFVPCSFSTWYFLCVSY